MTVVFWVGRQTILTLHSLIGSPLSVVDHRLQIASLISHLRFRWGI